MERTAGEINQYIRDVVRKAKDTAKVDTGYLKRSIRGLLLRRNMSVVFRQIYYGVYKDNSQLIQIVNRMMPNDIVWKVLSEDEEGREVNIEGRTRTGRTISRAAITSGNVGTNKIKALIAALKLAHGQKDNDSGTSDKSTD